MDIDKKTRIICLIMAIIFIGTTNLTFLDLLKQHDSLKSYAYIFKFSPKSNPPKNHA